MSLKNDVLFLGLGNCGCKQAKVFFEMGYKAMFANGSEQDLKILGDVPNIYRLKNFDGFGGHRERALECLADNEEFVEALQNIKEKIIFELHSTAGSTGSGIAPYSEGVLTEEKDDEGNSQKIVCPVPTLPSFDEPIGKKRSAYKAMLDIQEMQDALGATFFINNNALTDYDSINSIFANLLNSFLTNDSYGKKNNFDESEKIEMLRQPGAAVLGLFGKDHDKSFMLERMTKNGIFAPIENNQICGDIAVVHSGADDSDITVGDMIAEFGKPFNIFEGYNNGNSTLICVNGLEYPVSHIKQIGDLAQKAFDERKRNRKNAEKLSNLDFMEDEAPKATTEKKPSTKLDMLRKRMKK